MELRNTEQEVNDMLNVYNELYQRCEVIAAIDCSLPPIKEFSSSDRSGNGTSKPTTTNDVPLPPPPPAAAAEEEEEEEYILQGLESMKSKLTEMESRVKKFRQRLGEKDAITDAPRYGEKTAIRVQNVLSLHGIIKRATWIAYGLSWDEENEKNDEREKKKTTTKGNPTTTASDSSVVTKLRAVIEAKQETKRLVRQQEQQQAEAMKAADLAEKERIQQETERRRLEEVEAQRREHADLARRAEESRQATRQAQEAAAQAEREWIDSIQPIGPEGVREQIRILKEDTQNDRGAQKIALQSLLTIFSQIASHPEEINYRRIRRDHTQFQKDIGRHRGGEAVFIAAGFKLTTIDDDVKVFFSKEPDIEKDMDGWSLWFDNLKANLEVVKDMQ